MTVLQENYKISKDWNGSRYLGLNLNWDYTKLKVHLSMLTYVTATLKRFNRAQPRKPQDQPYPHIKTIYGAKAQYAKDADTSSPLSPSDKTIVQEVTGTFLYYARAVDPIMLAALGTIASQQATPTEQTMQKVKQFLDYAATHPCHHHLPRKRHSTSGPQQRLVSL